MGDFPDQVDRPRLVRRLHRDDGVSRLDEEFEFRGFHRQAPEVLHQPRKRIGSRKVGRQFYQANVPGGTSPRAGQYPASVRTKEFSRQRRERRRDAKEEGMKCRSTSVGGASLSPFTMFVPLRLRVSAREMAGLSYDRLPGPRCGLVLFSSFLLPPSAFRLYTILMAKALHAVDYLAQPQKYPPSPSASSSATMHSCGGNRC